MQTRDVLYVLYSPFSSVAAKCGPATTHEYQDGCQAWRGRHVDENTSIFARCAVQKRKPI